METWHPRALYAGANREGQPFIGAPWKLILHTIEADPQTRYSYTSASYFGHAYWPHATIDTVGIHQHLGIGASGFALEHPSGGPETNLANTIQCEIMGRASQINDIPDETWRHLADWLTWCAEQTGTPIVFPQFYGDGRSHPMGDQEWYDFHGIAGHQHAPRNEHWDPGAIDVDKLAALMGTTKEEDDMTPDEHKTLYETKDLGTSTNAALARVETAVRDGNGGLQAQMDRLIKAVEALKPSA